MGFVRYGLYVVVEFTEGSIFPDKFGPMFTKYSLKLFAISTLSVIVLFL